MYKDIIHYELAEGISKEHLLQVAADIVKTWMKDLPGFQKWEIHENENSTFTDIVYWQSKEDAKNAEKAMAEIPNAAEWFKCYKSGSISSQHLHLAATF